MALNGQELEQLGVTMLPALEIIMKRVREILPAGTNFAVLIEAQNEATRASAILAASTDRERMVARAAEWVLQELRSST